MLTARTEPDQRVKGFEIGVDDYMAKPFEPRELLIRIGNILKRRDSSSPAADEVRMGDFVFHLGRGELRRGDETIKLTERERDLMRQFATRAGTPNSAARTDHRRSDGKRAGNRRADQPAATENRNRPGQSGLPADRARPRLHPVHRLMVATTPEPRLNLADRRAVRHQRVSRVDEPARPKGPLYPRADHHHRADGAARIRRRFHLHGAPLGRRHAATVASRPPVTSARWSTCTRRYSAKDDYRQLIDIANKRMGLNLQVLESAELPPARPKTFFDLLDRTLSTEIRSQMDHPFWLDTVGRSRQVEVRVKLPTAVLRIIANRSQTYASNSHILLIWMIGTSLVLLTVAIIFLRNQIRPILRLAEAADAFGKGRPVPSDFRPRGAREVRQAAHAFLEMRDRIERHVEQRTTMLAGVSHDLQDDPYPLQAGTGDVSRQRRGGSTEGRMSTRCSRCSKTTWPSPRAAAARRSGRSTCGPCWRKFARISPISANRSPSISSAAARRRCRCAATASSG